MRIFKLILISIIMLCIAVIFVFSLFPSNIRISRVIDIHASKEKIFGVINDINTWKNWNEFVKEANLDNISVPSNGKGAYIESSGMRVSITASSVDSVKTQWVQKDKHQFDGGYNLVQTNDVVVVEWYFNFHFRWYPWEKLGSMFYDKHLGPVMEKSLVNLKNLTENP